ncbi:hypothetical protein [Streptomyces heilongjiangensis]|uniref:Uncharacterized protein n=1 Tax=Streptomyces heilongjiangensis TaxID=945052 RepID=A0ABW1BKM2_9ACTN|nr:hypothetical protein [Streptomyces heilongjiangensis]MDC2952540.1 hypothetical protein [Streptomyces heilongjiangensis]
MFEIRVICDPADTDRITTTLTTAFTTGDVRRYPTRDGNRTRLYLTADHHPAPADWPTPEQAYAGAPSINSEIGWTARFLADAQCYTALGREFYLRKAALLDRIALLDEPAAAGNATTTAEAAAVFLLDMDQPGIICDPRAYVRQQYARALTDDL